MADLGSVEGDGDVAARLPGASLAGGGVHAGGDIDSQNGSATLGGRPGGCCDELGFLAPGLPEKPVPKMASMRMQSVESARVSTAAEGE